MQFVNNWENHVNLARLVALKNSQAIVCYKDEAGGFHIRRVTERPGILQVGDVYIDDSGNATEQLPDGDTIRTSYLTQPWREGRPALFRR